MKSLGHDGELLLQKVMTRNDLLETQITGLPKKETLCYIQVNECYKGAIMHKRDIKELKKWCEEQLENWGTAPDITKKD